MERIIRPARRVQGEITVPPDKSLSHRALMLGAIARGRSLIKSLSPGGDVQSTLKCLSALGVKLEISRTGGKESVAIYGRGLYGLKPPKSTLDAGNSGTTMRLLAGILAGQPFPSTLSGDESLKRRPMGRIIEPLERMGARIESHKGRAPLTIRGGRLKGICYELPVASAQVKSCLLLAGLYAQGETIVVEPIPTRDHTERLLERLGADLRREGNELTVIGGRELEGFEMEVPGDLSSAAFLIAAATLVPKSELVIHDVGVNPTRTGFLECLRAMGEEVEVLREWEQGGEPVADLVARAASKLRAVEVGGALIPRLIDEIPLLAVLATQAEGTTVIRDARELRFKETDRLRAAALNLQRMGAQVEERPDGLVIPGPQRLKGARIESHGDHRIAMAFAIAALIAEGPTTIEGAEWADISFPGFFELLDTLTSVHG